MKLTKHLNPKWLRITIFYLIAILFSFYFRVATPEWYNQLDLPYGLAIFKDWLGGLGPFLGATIVTWLFKPKRRNTLLGTSKLKSMLMAIIPMILFTIFGGENSENLNPHLFGFYLGVLVVVYCILEETGWRGYLQDELRGINPILKYVIIGFLWYVWHLSFLGGLGGAVHIKKELIIMGILIAGSVGIGHAVEATQSVMVGACFHMIGNIMAFSSLLRSVRLRDRLLIVGISLLVWIILLIFWEKRIFIMQTSQDEEKNY